ncbi:unnamed protein product [Sympodiomycopsis kandeliae]
MSSSDPLGVLRSHIEAASAPVPDEGTLLALLAVENGDPLRAARLIIDDHRASNRASASGANTHDSDSLPRRRPRPREEQMEFAENEQEYERAIGSRGNIARRPNNEGRGGGFAADGILGLLYQTISLPFSLVQSLIAGFFKILGWLRGSSSNGAAIDFSADADGKLASKAFVDGLKDVAAEGEESISIPETFLQTSYNDALKRAKSELKMLVVILTGTSPASDSFLEILRSSSVLSTLSNPNYLIWCSSITRREGYQVSKSLMARQFPMVGCISLRCPPGTTSAPQLSLISKTSSALSSSESTTWFINSCFKKCSTTLEVLQAEQESRSRERLLMQEQDRAYEEVSRRDAEKIAQRRAQEEQQRRQAEDVAQQEALLKAEREKKLSWLLSHRSRLQSECNPDKEGTQIQAVLPSGLRINRYFSIDSPIEDIFTWIEISALPSDLALTSSVDLLESYQHSYEFTLYHGYPRQKLEFSKEKTIRDVKELGSRLQFIVEGRLCCDDHSGEKEGEESSDSSDEEE